MKEFSGKILFLDRDDINTDEIIPAKYLVEITKDALKPFLLEDLHLDGFSHPEAIQDINIVITRANFGCGSSREHAPWALEVNGINLVLAENFARIFKQNMFNCGMMAVSLSAEIIDLLFKRFAGTSASLTTDLDKMMLTVTAEDQKMEIPFEISDYNRSLVEAGGWVDYADQHY
ncbi:MAG: 3-isopropylmalate dehydratase [Desulfobacteraceae bacterium 4572_19]|nr:MAG: 3-isopropylmalate dehydratase [Desulfobacteraceae bacterium 4572_19]